MLVWGSDPSSWIKEVAGGSGQGDAKMGGDGENEDEAERCKVGSLRKGTTFFPLVNLQVRSRNGTYPATHY